ncbi:glycosyltransferase family 4 protein [Pikeienuella piscinae]|uniref:Glycosyltransferase family 4 protein n=1 Tax=Pikeienuella piscinae TaxID=2748098 RepID=A0A7L5BYH3_9RHOB|nr:glycosyltransferase [Pikeienuella piscinae]QIE55567.1 glycosyltransferase family 4 protein [Pikeienuella piscinae]
MRILHISADYPDPLFPAKTRAIANLLKLTEGHEHRVVSLNRIGWRNGIAALDFADAAGAAHRAVAYGAPPKGVLMKHYLDRLTDWIAADCEAAGFTPDLVHAHKLSVEGPVGWALARRWGKPFAVSIQGDSDLRIIGVKRALRPLYARIWREAVVVFPFAPWAAARLEQRLGARDGPVRTLPCPGLAEARLAPQTGPPVIVSAFHFASADRKNAAALIRAIGKAGAEIPDISLDIAGGGDPAAFARLAALAQEAAPGRVRFLGAVPNTDMQRRFNAACGFALVSRRESFGMVFSEALLAGAPCLIPRGWGVDGYFDEGSVVISADPNDETEIADGLVRLVREQVELKARLAALGEEGGLDFLRGPAIRDRYLAAIEAAAGATQ